MDLLRRQWDDGLKLICGRSAVSPSARVRPGIFRANAVVFLPIVTILYTGYQLSNRYRLRPAARLPLTAEHPRWRRAIWTGFALLSLSVLTTKQHYVIDLPGGLLTAGVGVLLSKWLNQRDWPQSRHKNRRRAPGPTGHWLAGHLPALRRDVLGLMTGAAREFRNIARFRLGPHTAHLINHPDHVKRVLQERHQFSDKNTRSVEKIKAVSGESLLTP